MLLKDTFKQSSILLSSHFRGVARTGGGGPCPSWQKTGPLLEKSFFKKLINFNKKISVQNWHIFSPLSQKRYLLIIIMCPVMSAKVGPLNILCGPSWAKILATPLSHFSTLHCILYIIYMLLYILIVRIIICTHLTTPQLNF